MESLSVYKTELIVPSIKFLFYLRLSMIKPRSLYTSWMIHRRADQVAPSGKLKLVLVFNCEFTLEFNVDRGTPRHSGKSCPGILPLSLSANRLILETLSPPRTLSTEYWFSCFWQYCTAKIVLIVIKMNQLRRFIVTTGKNSVFCFDYCFLLWYQTLIEFRDQLYLCLASTA